MSRCNHHHYCEIVNTLVIRQNINYSDMTEFISKDVTIIYVFFFLSFVLVFSQSPSFSIIFSSSFFYLSSFYLFLLASRLLHFHLLFFSIHRFLLVLFFFLISFTSFYLFLSLSSLLLTTVYSYSPFLSSFFLIMYLTIFRTHPMNYCALINESLHCKVLRYMIIVIMVINPLFVLNFFQCQEISQKCSYSFN